MIMHSRRKFLRYATVWGSTTVLPLSCKKENEENEAIPYFNIIGNPKSISVESTALEMTYQCQSNAGWEFVAGSLETWVTVSPSSGKNDGAVTVSIEENNSVKERSMTFAIKVNGVKYRTLTFIQNNERPRITLSPAGGTTIAYPGGTIAIRVDSNLDDWDFTLTGNEGNWCQAARIPDGISLSANANNGGIRKVILNVTSSGFPGENKSLTVTQDTNLARVLRDKLWMWGHEPETINGMYNIPVGNNIGMADAIRSMGIPNVCVICFLDKPEPPFDEYIKQFSDTKRVAWSILSGPPQKYTYEQQKQEAFGLLEKMPNLDSFYLDDYFHGNAVPVVGNNVSPACLTPEQVRNLREEMQNLSQKPELAVVLYAHQLHPGIKPHIDHFDVVSFWTWWANDLAVLEDNFKKYRDIVPDKPTLLGIYMWDFGNSKPIPVESMKLQLDFALEKLKQEQIDGMIFHCTPLCDLDLEAVRYSRQWIAEHCDEET
ncbi:MAG: BACON domain-containing protein [Mangrovibacterium sp.]